jgi:hypothetical protein
MCRYFLLFLLFSSLFLTAGISAISSAESISTLDVYGVATVFAWMLNPSKFYPVSGWLQSDPVVLPSNII